MSLEELGIKVIPGKIRWSTICPKCNDTRQKHKNAPCLTVNNEPGNVWWHCNHTTCGWSGNLDMMDKYARVHEKSRMPKQIAETYSKEVRMYLEGRGIDQRIALKEKIYEFSVAGTPRLGFPFYINLTLVNVKFFNVRWNQGDDSSKWYQLPNNLGTRHIFLGMQSLSFDVDEKNEVIITEGEWDWLTWKQCGYKNVVSVPMGAPNPNAKEFEHEFDYANDKYVQSFFADVESIIFSTDNDAPGHTLRNQLALIFGRERCKYIQYPIGYKDINDVFNGNKKGETIQPALGKAGVDECYNNLSSFPVRGIIRPQDVKEELEMIASDGFIPGFGIGIPEIDELFTLKRKHLTVVTGLPSVGKALSIDTPIPTINGFKPMGDIRVGDILFDENGEKCNVINTTGIIYNHVCYKITFSDSTEIIADEGHLWETETRSARMSRLATQNNKRNTGRELQLWGPDQSYKREVSCIKTTKQIAESLFREHGKRLNHTIRIAKPVKWENRRKMLIDPYVLGVWLGGGHSYSGMITSADIEIINEIRKRGYDIKKSKAKYVCSWYLQHSMGLLKEMGLIKNKHIPQSYLYNSIENRIDLLRGLMDTNGSMDKKRNIAEFCSTNKGLAEGVYTLLSSLEMCPAIAASEAKLYGHFICLRYRVNVRPVIPIFNLQRKLANQNLILEKRSNTRSIRRCTKIDSVPVKCIEVDSPSKLFLCSKAFIPTHNSVWVRWYLSEFICHNEKEKIKWALFTPENRPVSREQAKLAEVITGQSFKRGYKNSMSESLRNKTMRYIQQHFFFISPNKMNFETWKGKVDSDHVNSMESLLKYLEYLSKTERIFGFVIDAWNKIEHEQPKNMTETTFISKQLDYLLNFCDVYDVHCILIAHPTKIEKVGINYRMPCLYDIKGSSAWKEKADLGIILHRYMIRKKKTEDIPDDASEDDKTYIDDKAPTVVHIEKIRFEEIGKVGKIKMKMDYARGGRFTIIEDEKKKPPPQIEGALNPVHVEEDEEPPFFK